MRGQFCAGALFLLESKPWKEWLFALPENLGGIFADSRSFRAGLKGGEATETGGFAFACQYIVSPRGRTGNRTVTQTC